MLAENMLFAQKLLQDALLEYEGNGNRYNQEDRQHFIDLIVQVDRLRKKLTVFIANLPYPDEHPIDSEPEMSGPVSFPDLFAAIDQDKYISPLGPLKHNTAYRELKAIFGNIQVSVEDAAHLLQGGLARGDSRLTKMAE
jgi:hypothetical protein